MGEKLTELLKMALSDFNIKNELIKTKTDADPLDAFCKKAKEFGVEISLADLLWDGEDFCSAMLRSVNGGGVDAFDSWTDFYDLFFASLEG